MIAHLSVAAALGSHIYATWEERTELMDTLALFSEFASYVIVA